MSGNPEPATPPFATRDVPAWQSLAEALSIPLERIDRLAQVAWRLYLERKYHEAASVFRGLTALDPENIDLYRGRALAAAGEHDLVAAIESLDQALLLLDGKEERDDDRAQLLALRAGFLFRAGRRRQALESAETALRLAPKARWQASLRARAQRAQRPPQGQRHRSPSRRAARDLERLLQGRLSEVESGRRTLAWAVGYDDAALLRLFRRGTALLEAGHPFRARRVFEGLIALEARVPLFHIALAHTWDALGDARQAGRAFGVALAHARRMEGGDDLVADTLLRRARYFARRAAVRRALRDLDEALSLPAGSMGADARGRALALRGALARARVPDDAASVSARTAPRRDRA